MSQETKMTPEHRYYPKTLDQKLGYLVEECGEVLAAVGKTQRWGIESRNPNMGPTSETNRQWILRELRDLEQAIAIVREAIGP
jgi:NTP pyrophosphatase (non-canonical NTP hydrolase)